MLTPPTNYRGAHCALLVTGTFTAPFPDGVNLDLSVELYLPDGQHAKVIGFEGNVCEWAKVKQFSLAGLSLPETAKRAKRAADVREGEEVDVCETASKAVKEGLKTTLEVGTDLVQGFVLEVSLPFCSYRIVCACWERKEGIRRFSRVSTEARRQRRIRICSLTMLSNRLLTIST